MVKKNDENNDEYNNYYDVEDQSQDKLKAFTAFINQFLGDILLYCLLIGLFFLVCLVIVWIFSHDICIPCVYCFRSERAWYHNIIMFITAGSIPNSDFRVTQRYCANDGMILDRIEYKKAIKKFDEMAAQLEHKDRKLIDQLLERYKYKQDPYRIVSEEEREHLLRLKNWKKLKKSTEKPTKIVVKTHGDKRENVANRGKKVTRKWRLKDKKGKKA